MSARAGSRIVIDEAAYRKMRRGIAMGLHSLAEATHSAGERLAPKRTPRLAFTGGTAAYVDGSLVAGADMPGAAADSGGKPAAYCSWDFPGHLLELGTTDTAAQPFAVPAALQTAGEAPRHVATGLRKAGL